MMKRMGRAGAPVLVLLFAFWASACGDVIAAKWDSGVVSADTGQPGDAFVPGEDQVGPVEDAVEPPEDSVVPPEDGVDPPEDSVEPPDDTVVADVPVVECWDGVLEPAYGEGIVTVHTLEGSDDFAGSCGGVGGKDYAYLWTVPFSDWFEIDTFGSDFDTVLYLLEGGCEGAERACANDVSETETASWLVGHFEQGETYVIVVDGNAGARGNAVLNIRPVECPVLDVGDGSELPQAFTMVNGESSHMGDCGGEGPEQNIRFIAPERGLWRISATADPNSDLQTALYVERGPVCGGELLQCNGHDDARIGMPTEVSRFLEAGEPVTIVVDSRSGSGSFDLDAKLLTDVCPAHDLSEFNNGALDFNDESDTMTTTCGLNSDIEWESFHPYADMLIGVDDMEPGSGGGCTVVVSAGFPFSLAVVGGECAGAEIACALSENTGGDELTPHRSSYTLPKLGGRLTLVVSPVAPNWSGWTSSEVAANLGCVMK